MNRIHYTVIELMTLASRTACLCDSPLSYNNHLYITPIGRFVNNVVNLAAIMGAVCIFHNLQVLFFMLHYLIFIDKIFVVVNSIV